MSGIDIEKFNEIPQLKKCLNAARLTTVHKSNEDWVKYIWDNAIEYAEEQAAKRNTNAPTVQREPDGYFYTSMSGVKDYFFGAMHDDTKLLFESGDISNVNPFYFEPTNQLYDMHECQITLNNTPLYKQAYDLIQEIEALGSSLELTSAVKNAGALADNIVKREMQFHHIYKAFSELNAPTRFGEPTVQREGWVSVPIEPTEEMIREALDCQEHDPEDDAKSEVYYMYKAMIQAAPKDTE